jgi:hypothetical protein
MAVGFKWFCCCCLLTRNGTIQGGALIGGGGGGVVFVVVVVSTATGFASVPGISGLVVMLLVSFEGFSLPLYSPFGLNEVDND